MSIASASSATAIQSGAFPFAALINATIRASRAKIVLIDMQSTVSRLHGGPFVSSNLLQRRIGPEPAITGRMKARDQRRTATRWLLVIGLQLPALLSVQSCKNDRAEPKTEARDQQQRAVFG